MNQSHLLYRDVLTEPPADWLERNIYMSREVSPNAPGMLSLAGQPWAREILRVIDGPKTQEVELVMGAQTGKTTILLLTWMLFARFYPTPCLIGLSTDALADRLAKQRLIPLIKANPAWGEKLPPANRGQESMILFPGQFTFYTGSRTPSKLSSFPASLLLLDEVCKWESGSRKEAHPYMLVRERVKSFASHKIISSSTPTIPEEPFWQSFLQSSQSFYQVPCPHCNAFFKFEFSAASIKWENSRNLETVRASAHYVCPYCGGRIENHHRPAMLDGGKWVAENPHAPRDHFGFHVNSFYSPFVSFGDIAAEFVSAHNSIIREEAFRNFHNSWLALPWEEKIKKTSDSTIRALVSKNPDVVRGKLPAETDFLFCGIDPGANGTHFCVCAVEVVEVGDVRLHVVDWGELHSYSSARGQKGPGWFVSTTKYNDTLIDCALIDSGFQTQEVYNECASFPEALIPSKGTTASIGVFGMTPLHDAVIENLITYKDYSLKKSIEEMKLAGKIVLPYDITEDFITGISGQTLIRTGGRFVWKDLREDHFNDCLKLCLLAAWCFTPESFVADLQQESPDE